MGDIKLVGDRIFECEEGGVGRRGAIGVGYVLTNDLRDGFSRCTGKVVEGGDGGAPGPNVGVGMLFMLGFG